MPDVVEVADKIYRVQVAKPGLVGCTIYFIADSGGAVVDPGFGMCVPTILEVVRHLGMADLAFILPTHIHVDHAGAAGELARHFPGSKVVAHPSARDHLVDPGRLIESTKKSYGSNFESKLGTIKSVPESQILAPDDGSIIDLGGRLLQVVYSPGHAPHHITFLDLKTRGLFAGEALGMRSKSRKLSPFPNAAPPAFDPDKYVDSIAMLKRLRPRVIFYAHDGVARDPAEMPLLFDNLAANTVDVCGRIRDMVLQGLNPDSVQAGLREYVEKDLGQDWAELDMEVTVAGIDMYYRRLAQNG